MLLALVKGTGTLFSNKKTFTVAVAATFIRYAEGKIPHGRGNLLLDLHCSYRKDLDQLHLPLGGILSITFKCWVY
ncbi:hypothetical protein D5R40_31050 [Okeania hirsuta]|uniref:Uncharacterized protein n=1 Tax=Okeania hirsuta TaxID=1458930 RepID=A0A3N6NXJ5_9CYAN|nr:hypothetical protein D5R40_31050 [Okeania hirsuta]